MDGRKPLGRGGLSDDEDDGPSPLFVGLLLLEDLPDVFRTEVLPRLNTTERALFARAAGPSTRRSQFSST